MNSMPTPLIVDPSELAYPSIQVAGELLGCTLVRQLPDAEQIRGLSLFCHSPRGQSLEALLVSQYKLSYYKNWVVVFVVRKK